MTDKIIEYINNNVPIDVIKKELNLSNKQLMYYFRLIKNRGFNLTKKVFNDGSVIFDYNKLFNNDFKNINGIYTKNDENSFRCLVISDLHFFHKNDSIKSINSVFDYCVKNNIKVILLCGDLINGLYKDNISIEKEASKFIELYPSEESINTLCLLGNHDYNYLKNTNIDFGRFIDERRSDILPLGYGCSPLGLKKDYIIMRHKIESLSEFDGNFDNYHKSKITLSGHSHFYKTKGNNIHVPSLSNVYTYNQINDIYFTPQALDLQIQFSKNMINSVIVDHLIVLDKCKVIGENIISVNTFNSPREYDFNVSEYPRKILK